MSEDLCDNVQTAEDCPVLVRINLVDCYASSTKVKVDASRTAFDICEILSTKLGVSDTDAMFFSLVCVAKCTEKKNMHWVHTLKATDYVLRVQEDMEKRAIGRCSSAAAADTVTSSFYYKDIRSNPLDLDGDMSGNSSSDDEEEIPLNDLMYFGSGERRGFLMKRSSRDPNVWRRRLCILNDKLWCINVRKSVPWAFCVKLSDTTVLEDRPDLKYTNTITLAGSNGQTLFFRTNAPLEKHRWREEIRERTLYGADNEVITMAEMIITDEEEMAEIQMQKCFLQVLHSPQVWQLVGQVLDLTECQDNWAVSDASPQAEEESILRSDSSLKSDNALISPASPSGLCLSKKIGRWPHQVFHLIHKSSPSCAAGLSLICAVQHYKGSFRHDFYVRPKQLWGNALHVYIHYILPYMDFMKGEQSEQGREEGVSEGDGSMQQPPNQHISMEAITQLHRALFSNIRKKRKSAARPSSSATSTPRYSTWFWSSLDKTNGSSSAASTENNEEEAEDKGIYNTDYEILDSSTRPDMDMYDDFVRAIYEKLKEVT